MAIQPKTYDGVFMSVSLGGAGSITLGSALSTFRSFASAGVADQEQVICTFVDGAAREVSLCTYTSSGTTLSRKLIWSTSGALLTLTTSAVVFIDENDYNLRWKDAAGLFGARDAWDFGRQVYRKNHLALANPQADPQYQWTGTSPRYVQGTDLSFPVIPGGQPPIAYGNGLLCEGASSNLLLHTQDPYDSPWTLANLTGGNAGSWVGQYIGANAALTETTATGVHAISQPVPVVNGAAYTGSVYVNNYNLGNFAYLDLSDGTNSTRLYVNLTTGATQAASGGAPTGVNAYVVNAGNGFYRIVVTMTQVAGTTMTVTIGMASALGTASYTGVATHSISIYGASLEPGASATSIMTTYNTAAARELGYSSLGSPLIPYWPGPLIPQDPAYSTSQTWYVRPTWPQGAQNNANAANPAFTMLVNFIAPPSLLAATQALLGTDGTPIPLYINSSGNLAFTDGSNTRSYGAVSAGASHIAALSYAGAATGAVFVGLDGAVTSSGGGFRMQPASTLFLGCHGGSYAALPANPLNGYIKKVLIFDRAMGAGELAAITALAA